MNGITVTTQQAPIQTGNEGGQVAGQPLAGGVKPVLDGASVSVTQATDFEKLLARMEMERDEKRQELCAQRFASALLTLAGQHGSLSSAQGAALVALAEKSEAYEQACRGRNTAQTAYDAASVELAVLTEKLEAMVKAQTKTPEEREKELEAKEEKAEAATAEEKAEAATAEDKVEALEDDTAEIEALKAKVAEQEKTVAERKAARDAAEGTLNAAGSALAGATHAAMTILDGAQAKAIAGAVRQLAAEIVAAAVERKDDDGTVDKANAVIEAMEQYAEALEEMRREELDEAIAKISTDLQFLLRCDRMLRPEELGEYTKTV